ncbi:hypothetical protein BC443_01020 [Salinicola sp. MIT1003]|nr:hypothetical protein BC443_01020 [Salinicola sp. MIT1003]
MIIRMLGGAIAMGRPVVIGTVAMGTVVISTIAPASAAQSTWVGQLPRQTVVVSERPLESAPITLPSSAEQAEIAAVRWVFETDAPAPTLKTWLCHGQLCLPLVRSRGETQRFAGRAASLPFRLRFLWPPGKHASGDRVITGGQLIVDYRQ